MNPRRFLPLLLVLLVSACSEETLTPPDDTSQRSFYEISSDNFDQKTSITQGVAGTVFKVTSADIGIGGIIVQDATPMQANIGLYDTDYIEMATDPYGDSTYFIYNDTLLVPVFVAVTRTSSDNDGFYEIPAEPRSFTMIVSEQELPDTLNPFSMLNWDFPLFGGDPEDFAYPPDVGSYNLFDDLYWFDQNVLMSQVLVLPDSVRKADVFLQTPEDPWWPPEDSLDPWWPPEDTVITWPPDTGWVWPPDSLNPYIAYWDLLEYNRGRVTIETGIYGTVTDWRYGGIDPMPYPVRVYEVAYPDSDDVTFGESLDGWWISEVHTPFIAEVYPDSLGFYQVELPAGDYSVFAVFGGDSLFGVLTYNMSPMIQPYLPGTIEEGFPADATIEVTGYASWLFTANSHSGLRRN